MVINFFRSRKTWQRRTSDNRRIRKVLFCNCLWVLINIDAGWFNFPEFRTFQCFTFLQKNIFIVYVGKIKIGCIAWEWFSVLKLFSIWFLSVSKFWFTDHISCWKISGSNVGMMFHISLITGVFTERCHFMNVHCSGPFSVSLAFILECRISIPRRHYNKCSILLLL